ncbi:zinc ribbon domain-containing protein YjdM [Campylobacter sp. 19-13652]|uniref:zinc ribbon domain-containing protein YjdM n=1 Tax=Campylobacter sp. 19-13652 TaxID=2840180 RepID=UPI001C74D043|nr:zinc ribbon domain-containing protein YjdM [Campylobacter sp. 19-13652]BCX79940.1 hypothetical protein LBC_14020 [Campylobacter sp. 19-13652]
MSYPKCPKCNSEYTYLDGELFVCPECAHEWKDDSEKSELIVKDANGTQLADGDSVVLIKDLKSRGTTLKQGTKIKSIKLQDKDHNIACKIDGSAWELKSEFVKKA